MNSLHLVEVLYNPVVDRSWGIRKGRLRWYRPISPSGLQGNLGRQLEGDRRGLAREPARLQRRARACPGRKADLQRHSRTRQLDLAVLGPLARRDGPRRRLLRRPGGECVRGVGKKNIAAPLVCPTRAKTQTSPPKRHFIMIQPRFELGTFCELTNVRQM